MQTSLQWDEPRVARLSIWFTAYIAWYFAFQTAFAPSIGAWAIYPAFGLAVLMATLTLRYIFHSIVARDALVRLIDWATKT